MITQLTLETHWSELHFGTMERVEVTFPVIPAYTMFPVRVCARSEVKSIQVTVIAKTIPPSTSRYCTVMTPRVVVSVLCGKWSLVVE